MTHVALGGDAWIIDYVTERKVQVVAYYKTDTAMNHIKIGGGITALIFQTKQQSYQSL